MKVKVYAKLNLTLNVTGKRNGFHDIDSVAASVGIFDEVTVTARRDRAVTISGMPTVNDADNSAYRAACAFVKEFDILGADISVKKGIPFSAGMGGSSADAAAVVYCMCGLYGVDVSSPRVHSLCAYLGSDVNFMLRGGLGRLRGKGDDAEYYPLNSPLYFALTTFDQGVTSGQAYSAYDALGESLPQADNRKIIEMLTAGENAQAIPLFNNHLERAVTSFTDYQRGYLNCVNRLGLSANMTGSGSAYYVAFASCEQATAASARLRSNGYNTVVCKTVPRGIEAVN